MTDDTQHIAEQAAEWLERLKNAGPTERAEYLAWLRASKRHVQEMLLATAWDRVLDDLQRTEATPNREKPATKATTTTSPKAKHLHAKRATPPVWPWLLLAATSLLLWVALPSSERYRTELGEQRTVTLLDGSRARLNTLTNLTVDFTDTRRDLYLAGGQATFDVQHDAARPFVVHAGSTSIIAIGTRFDVFRADDSIRVAVLEGTIEVTGAHSRERLTSGDALTLSATARRRVRMPPDEAIAWHQHRLIFHDRTLLEIAAEFNRYNKTKLTVMDPDLHTRRYSGTFHTNDPQSFAAYVATDASIEVIQTKKDYRIRLRSNESRMRSIPGDH